MLSLDDPRRMERLDGGRMLETLDAYLDAFLAAYRSAGHARLAAPPGLGHVLVAGMGGSGIGANLVAALARPECPVPVVIVKDYDVPAHVGPKTLVLAVSYSGETEETLSVAREAVARGATLIGISSGGQLQRFAREAGRHLAVPGGLQPRAALPHLLGTLLGAFHALGLATRGPDARLAGEVRAFHATVRPVSRERRNPAKRLARALHARFPVWYGAGALAPVALRARCQLNENAKMLARNDELPEANHNDLVAWAAARNAHRYHVTFLRDASEPPEIARRFAFVARTLTRRRVAHEEFIAGGSSPLSRVLQALLFVDYASVYAAFLRGVDPAPVDVIAELKRSLSRAPASARRGS